MRIVGGKFKGRRLQAPEGQTTRPTSIRTRESVFNILDHQDWGRAALRGQRVLDVFAGSGALGVEALSRGAAHATFMDKDAGALKALAQTVKTFGLKASGAEAEVQVIRGDSLMPPKAPAPCRLVFMDAPYGQGLNEAAYHKLASQGWFEAETVFVTETAKKEKWEPPVVASVLDKRAYGVAEVTFWRVE